MKRALILVSLLVASRAEGADDTTPPTFAGATSAAAAGPTSITVRWAAAEDAGTPEKALRYLVCAGKGAKDCVKSFRPAAASAPGATEVTLTGLAPKTKYHLVVRAEDGWGNRDANKAVVVATTPVDTNGPAAVKKLRADDVLPASAVLVWDAPEDDTTPSVALAYDLCFSATESDCASGLNVSRKALAGATRLGFGGLEPNTTYHAAIRARDEAGNVGAAAVTSFTTPADKKAPRFAGAKSARATGGGTIAFEWDAAEDDVTPAAGIVYEVCASARAGGCKVSFAAKVTTAAGATKADVTGLSAGKTYSVGVRAVDAAGNRSEVVDRTVAMPADTTPPRFAGVTRVTAAADNSVTIEWAEATDDVAAPGEIVYAICWAPSKDTCNVAFSASINSAPGAKSATLTGLNPKTTYHVVVRAKDTAGNLDGNRVMKSATTP